MLVHGWATITVWASRPTTSLLSRHTIADYVKQIYRKLNVSSRAEAALEAQRLGLFRR